MEAALWLLQAALKHRPALAELPREEAAATAAANSLHALLALVADDRRNRQRLHEAGVNWSSSVGWCRWAACLVAAGVLGWPRMPRLLCAAFCS